MKKFIVTISREFGCDAREITRMLASRLGIEMYDKDLVELAARKAGISIDAFTDADKMIESPTEKVISRFAYGLSNGFYTDKAIQAQMDVIKEIAEKPKSCIFFGRCADYVLREYPNTLNVFFYSDLNSRIKHMMEAYSLTKSEAEKVIKRIDRQRHNYYKYVTGINRSDLHLKHIMLDVRYISHEDVVDILYMLIQKKFG